MDIDPNTVLDAFGKLSAAGLAIWWFAKRDDKNRDQAELRETAAADRCMKENAALHARLQLVEDRQFQSHNDILFAAAQALEVNARAFEKLSNIETDKFPAVDPKANP